MSLLLFSKQTDRMSYLVASLHFRCIQTTLLDDVVTAKEVLGASKLYSIVLIGADIRPSEAFFLIEQVQAMQRRLPVIAMHALICADHPKPHCSQSLINKSPSVCYAIDAAEIIILMMNGQISSHSIAEHAKRLRMIVDVASAKVKTITSQVQRLGSTGSLDSDELNLLYFNLLLLKELNNILLSNAYEVSSFS
jgi:hypothetical protein